MILSYINLITPSKHCGKLNDFNISTASPQEKDNILIRNRERLIFSSPNVSSSSQNVDFNFHKNVGVQMIGMCFQNYVHTKQNSMISEYHKWFNKEGAYIMKDDLYVIDIAQIPEADNDAYLNIVANPVASS